MYDQYTLLANQLRDIHNFLRWKILEHPKYTPKWKIEEQKLGPEPGLYIEEIISLLSLAETLEKMAAHHAALALPPESGVNYVNPLESNS